MCSNKEGILDIINVSRIFGILTGLEQNDLAEKVLSCISKRDRIDILSEWSKNFIEKALINLQKLITYLEPGEKKDILVLEEVKILYMMKELY